MDFSISREVYIMLWSFFTGVMIAFIYDLFKTIRKKVCTGVFFSNIHDMLFWVIATVIMFYVVFFINNGRLRWYQFLFMFSGGILYFLTLSRPITLILCRFIDVFFKIFNFFLKILLTPLKLTYNIVYVVLSSSILPVLRLLKRLIKKLVFKASKSLKTFKFLITKK